MIEKVVTIMSLKEAESPARDLAYWLSRPAEERIAQVERLRRQYHGSAPRLQRVARVIQRPSR
jgi:hypothetical protein